jgi:hypothetical protein
MKRLTITVRVPVSVTVDAEEQSGEINIVNVVRTYLPTPIELMDALDNDGELHLLDEACANAQEAK